jgi:hypothetical protein
MIRSCMNIEPPTFWNGVAIGVSGMALTVSTLALLVGFLNFRRKSSLKLRASFDCTSSIECDDTYVSQVCIENLKDRATTIYAIYLRLGHNYFIELDDLDGIPLVIRPYETCNRKYGPILYYEEGCRRVVMRDLFSDKRSRMTIVLSTSEGKYVVKQTPRQWLIAMDYFKNYSTRILMIVRASRDGRPIGSGVKYFINAVRPDGGSMQLRVYDVDFQIRLTNEVTITSEFLCDKSVLSEFIQAKINQGELGWKSFTVDDVHAWRLQNFKAYSMEPSRAAYVSWIRYRVLGRLCSIISSIHLKMQNRRNRRRSQRKKSGGMTTAIRPKYNIT